MKESALLFTVVAACIAAVSMPSPAFAQSPGVKVYTQSQLLKMEQQLRDKDKSKGLASQTLETYDTRKTILVTRDKDGQAEMHAKVADFFVVVEGEATLVYGGSMVNQKSMTNGESLGDAVKDGTSMKLGKGDVVQIPPNIPHQLLVQNGKVFTYFVIKFQEHS
jgi:mannose-6-phosphate isomerase-like protein (cupin superfamily)